uniref:HotDog ACOT-type domain-containing protein n=1 Tax=Steinernema glaseri TaxID=37863 RepID=A0A1I8AS40_9BILA
MDVLRDRFLFVSQKTVPFGVHFRVLLQSFVDDQQRVMTSAVVTFKSPQPPKAVDHGLSATMSLEAAKAEEFKEKQKLGHRRIDRQGEVSYKRVPTNALMGAIQLGIANSIGSLASKPERQLLVQDFDYIENVYFPSEGSLTTPSHMYGDFRFKTYAPMAFRHFRDLFNIKPADFLETVLYRGPSARSR